MEMSNVLNGYFATVFTQDSSDRIPNLPASIDIPSIDNIQVTPELVSKKIEDLKASNSCGPDNISSFILKTFKQELLTPLTDIYNKSLQSGVVPEDWRIGNVTPIFKKGSKGNPANYRPVSLTSVPCKLLESILKDEVVDHLFSNNLLKDSQHGFMKGRSCTTNLLEFFHTAVDNLDAGNPMDIIYLDFAKAFDKVPTKKLLAKLKSMNINGNILNWISSWLRDWKQRVVLNGEASTWIEVLSGVPQGSVLGPLLFLIFINDIDDAAKYINILRKFADDTKLGHKVITAADCEIVQTQLDSLCSWATTWGMEFNVSKCKVLHVGRRNPNHIYTMNGHNLEVTEWEKDVGVRFDNTLKPSLQCREASRIANAMLNQLTRAFHYRDRNIFVNLYKRYVRVYLEYATPAWNPWQIGDIEMLEKVQRRFVKMISGLISTTYEDRLREIGLATLKARRVRADLLQVFKILKGIDRVNPDYWFTPESNTRPGTRSRSEYNVKVKFNNTEIGKNFFSTRAAIAWNALPEDLKSTRKISSFKKKLDIYIMTL